MSKGVQLIAVGRDPDGRVVVGNVYQFTETYGLPLGILLDTIIKKDLVVSWIHYYDDATAAGIKHDRIVSRVSEALLDALGHDERTVILDRLERYADYLKTHQPFSRRPA